MAQKQGQWRWTRSDGRNTDAYDSLIKHGTMLAHRPLTSVEDSDLPQFSALLNQAGCSSTSVEWVLEKL